MFRDYAAMAGLQSPVEKHYLDVYEQKQEYLMNWKHKFEMPFPLFVLTSEGKVLSQCLPGLAEVCLHNSAVLKSGTEW